MEILKDVPARVAVPHSIRRIVINIEEKIANVNIERPGEPMSSIDVNIVPILEAATTTQKNVIKGFIKTIIAAAMVIDEATVPNVFET